MRWTPFPIVAFTFLAAACHNGAATSNNSAPSGNGTQAVAGASDDPPASAGDVASAADFQLTDTFIAKYEAYEEEAAKNPCGLSPAMILKGDDADIARSIRSSGRSTRCNVTV